MKLYDFKMQLYQLNKYLPLLPGPHGHHLNDADMFDTIKECVPDWNNSYIASNTTTENINDLPKYYGKLKQQEAKRKLKAHHQDNSKSQQQPARNQNQCSQGDQNQCNGNNCHNEESFCSYHQLHGHSDAECHDPCNPKGVTTLTTTTNKIATTKTTKIVGRKVQH
jgi:5'-3' exonuclease